MLPIALPQNVNFYNLEPGEGGTKFPPGDYLVTIASFKTKPTKDGKTIRLIPTLRVDMGPGPGMTQHNGKKMYGSYNLNEEGMPYLLTLATAALGGGPQALQQARQWLATGVQQGQLDIDVLLNRQIVVSSFVNDQGYNNTREDRAATEFGKAGGANMPGTPPAASAPPPSMLQPIQQPGQFPQQAPQGFPQAGGFQPQQMPQGFAPQQGFPQPAPQMMPQQGGFQQPGQFPQQPGFAPQQPGQFPQQQQQQPGGLMAPPPPAGQVPGQTH